MLVAFVAAVLVVVLAADAASDRAKPLVFIDSGPVAPGDRLAIRVSGATPGLSLRLYLRASNVDAGRQVAIGRVVPSQRGSARLRFRMPRVPADVYQPAACCDRGRFIRGRGLLSVAAVAPFGFGPLGTVDCAPASPRNTKVAGTGPFEVFGTAAGAQFWALLFLPPGTTWASETEAELEGLVGKEMKIVFRLTSGIPTNFFAVMPGASRVNPNWKSRMHTGSNWARPGSEWGAGFVFPRTGCWRIHAGSPPVQADLTLLIRS